MSGLSLDMSIIESILTTLKKYFDTATSDSWLLPTDLAKPALKTSLYNNVLISLRKILFPLKILHEDSASIPIEKICSLVVAPSHCTKLNKQGHQQARKIMNDLSEVRENLPKVAGYLESRLEAALKEMIELLQARG